MSIRQDQAQLIITIDAKESVEYQKAVQRSNELVRNIKKMEVGTEEYNAAIREQVEISKRLAGADYSKLSLKNLQDRRKALQDQIRILPQAQAAELGLEQELKRVNQALRENAARTRAVTGAMVENTKSTINWRNIYAAGVALISGAVIAIGSVTARFQKYSAVLKVALGSQQEADKAMKQVKETASSTTYTVDELTESYVKFANRGIRLTKDEMISIADLAASQGKSFDQLTEAILDAQTGEFERLKEFGIRASKSGDQANISFKGFNTTAKLTPDAIKAAFVEMGKLNGVTGANAEQMTNITGRISNFRDMLDGLLNAIGTKYASNIGSLIGRFTEFGQKITEYINPTKTATEVTKNLQAEFNNEIGVLKRLSPEANGRKELIQQINEKYKEYLPNLISENASIRDIEKAQRDANKVFEEKLIYIAFEEEYKKQIEKTKEAIKQLSYSEIARARAQQSNKNLADIGASPAQLEVQKKANEDFIGIVQKNAQTQIDNNDKVIKELEDAFDKTAKRIGSSLDKIRNKFASKNDDETNVSNGSGSTPEQIKKAAEAREKAKADAEKAAKEKYAKQLVEREKLTDFLGSVYDPKFIEGAINYRLKQLEDAAKREQIILEESYQLGKITQDEYELEKLRNLSAHLATKLEMLSAAGLKESDKYREINVELLKTDKELREARAQQISELDNANLTEVEQKFRDRLITEDEYNLSRLAVQKNFLDEQLRLLEENGLTETEVYKKIQEEKAKVQADYNAQKLANEQRTQELMYQVQEQGLGAAADLFSLGAELLAGDEKARKKHASAIKAFETAKIAVNLAAEVQGIWKNANSNPINSLSPGWGPIYAAVQTGLAVGRAAIQVRNISSKQFKYGGRLKDGAVFDGPTHEYGGVKFGVGGEINEAEGGEIIINKRSSRVFAKELNEINTYNGYGKKLFSLGGVVSNSVPSLPSTTPTLSARVLGNNTAPQTIVQTDPRVEMLANSIEKLANIMPAALSNIRADVSYFDIKSKETTIEEIKYLARY